MTPFGRLAHPAQVEVGILLLGGRLAAVDLGIDQHVGEEEIALAHVLVVAGGVLPEAGPRAREAVGHEMPAGDELVHEVGRAPHEAEVVVRAQLEVLALAHQVLARVGDQERRGHRLPGGRRRVRHHVAVGRVPLHVVLLGDGPDRLLEDGLGGHVGDAPAAQVDARRLLLDRLDVLGSAPGRHGAHPFTKRGPRQPRGGLSRVRWSISSGGGSRESRGADGAATPCFPSAGRRGSRACPIGPWRGGGRP